MCNISIILPFGHVMHMLNLCSSTAQETLCSNSVSIHYCSVFIVTRFQLRQCIKATSKHCWLHSVFRQNSLSTTIATAIGCRISEYQFQINISAAEQILKYPSNLFGIFKVKDFANVCSVGM